MAISLRSATDLPGELRGGSSLSLPSRLMPDAAPRGDELTRLIAGLEAGRVAHAGRGAVHGRRILAILAPRPARRERLITCAASFHCYSIQAPIYGTRKAEDRA